MYIFNFQYVSGDAENDKLKTETLDILNNADSVVNEAIRNGRNFSLAISDRVQQTVYEFKAKCYAVLYQLVQDVSQNFY